VVATGYASLDYPALVRALPAPDTTCMVERRLSRWWPAFGGCGPLVCRWLASLGMTARLVTWIGDDELSRRYLRQLERSGVDTAGVVVTPGRRTGVSHLFYTATGEAVNFFEDGGATRDEATDTQLELARDADWLCLTVAPYRVNAALLEAAGPDTRVSWVVKADRTSFPPDLVRRILARSSLVTFSRGERSFLRDATGREQPLELLRACSVAVETHGREGVRLFTAEGERFIPVDPVEAADATGAGDIFHAGMVGRLLQHSADPLVATRAGVAAARTFLVDASWRGL
jgi:sugar/nucleoside kinase (ribokinase family)